MKTFLRIVMATTGVAVGLSSFAAQTTKSSPAAKPKANAPFANYSTESTLFNDKTLLANNMMVVTTTPYLGIRSDYAAGDLMINLPSINQDLELLQQRSVLEKRFNAAGVPFASRPIVELSGDVIGRAFVSSGYGTGRSDVDLRDAEFEINAIASSWVNAFMDIDYDRNTAPYTGDTSRVDNSRLYVNWAFINIGDLNRTPFYGTVGQMYVPFGRYGSYMITTPVTATLFQSTQRTALVGYAQNNWNAQAYAYHGPLNTNGRGNTINEGGANVSYNFATNMGQFKTGAGYITNIADADGFRDNGVRTAGVFQGFTRTDTSDQIAHRVGGVDLNGRWNNGPWGLTGEVILPTRRFAAADMQYNSRGAKPGAMYFEGTYKFNYWNKPITWALSYGHSWQAAALSVPSMSLGTALSTSLLKNTIEGIEYRHDINYSSSRYNNSTGSSTALVGYPGKTQNVVTAQVGVYF